MYYGVEEDATEMPGATITVLGTAHTTFISRME